MSDWAELAGKLAEPFPEMSHRTYEKAKGVKITYVPIWDYIHRLNATVGPENWESRTTLSSAGGKLIATVELTIFGNTKSNVGDEAEDKEGYGTAATNAWAMAFKRAAAEFGMGLYLYDKDAPKKPTPKDDSPLITEGPFEGRRISQVDSADYLMKWLQRNPTNKYKRAIVARLKEMGVPASEYAEYL